MNADFRRIALAAAALGLIVSLFFALRHNGSDEPGGTQSSATTTAATTAQEPTTTPPVKSAPPPVVPFSVEVVGGSPRGGIKRESVERGQQVRLFVEADVTDEIHVHGYDLSADVAPGKPAAIVFKASVPGRFEIELENRGVQIAELEVTP